MFVIATVFSSNVFIDCQSLESDPNSSSLVFEGSRAARFYFSSCFDSESNFTSVDDHAIRLCVDSDVNFDQFVSVSSVLYLIVDMSEKDNWSIIVVVP